MWIKHEPQPKSTIIKINEKTNVVSEKTDTIDANSRFVLNLNNKNKSIKSLTANNVTVKIWEGGFRFRLKGEMNYEKEKLFRIVISSIIGEELDLGANNDIFWYWSRRDRNPALYFAHYEDYNKTRLKTPFNPVFLRSSLGLEEIVLNADSKMVNKDEFLTVINKTKNSMGESILHSTVINTTNELIQGFVITDLDNNLLVSSEIQERNEQGIPEKIFYTWHEENRALFLEFSNPVVNEPISSDTWNIPNKNPKIDMGNE